MSEVQHRVNTLLAAFFFSEATDTGTITFGCSASVFRWLR
jgi:hypothetical protein